MSDVSPAERVEQIRAREKAATGEPWRWSDDRVPDLTGTYRAEGQEPYETYVIEAEHEGECACRSLCRLDLFVSDADAEFIAAAREDIPFLLARIAELEAELESAIISDIAARNPGIDLAELRAYRREKGLARG